MEVPSFREFQYVSNLISAGGLERHCGNVQDMERQKAT
jgi:hypothetical protein